MRRPSNVLYVSPVGERGGAERLLRNLIASHDRERVRVSVALLRPGPLERELERAGAEVHVIRATRLRDPVNYVRVVRELRRLIRDRHIDLVAGNLSMGHVYGGVAARLAGCKAIWIVPGAPLTWVPVDRCALRVPAHRIVVWARDIARRFQALRHWRGRDRVRALTMGVDLSEFDAVADGKAVRETFGITPTAPVIGMVARFEPFKGQDVFVRAATRIRRSLPDARFLLVGDTQFGMATEVKGDIESLVEELGLSSAVSFTGFRDDVAACIAAMDVVVHGPVNAQPGGLGLLEAMAMAKPVVTTDSGDRLEWLVPGETGVLIRGGDPVVMAEAIVELMSDATRRMELGRAGRARVESTFTAERMTRAMETVFEEVL